MEHTALIKEVKSHAEQQGGTATANPFPIDVMGKQVAKFARELEGGLSYPLDYTGAAFLFSLSVAIGNKFCLHVKGAEWVEYANLWLAVTGRAGTSKTHPVTFATRPLSERDKLRYAEYKAALKEFERLSSLSSEQRKAEAGTDTPQKPKRLKYLVDDTTPEALAAVIEDNPTGIGVCRDELSGWVKDFGRYSKGGEQERWLSIWSRKPINIDRKHGGSLYIHNPYVSVIGTIQPKVLAGLSEGGRGDNGFIDRILFAMPDKTEVAYWSDREIGETIARSWANTIERLLDIPVGYDEFGNIEPYALKYSPEAQRIFIDWYNRNADIQNETEEDYKQRSYINRFALILQLLSYVNNGGSPTEVEREAIEGAIKLTNYFTNTAQKARDIINNIDPAQAMPENKKKLYKLLPPIFTTKEALAMCQEDEKLNMSKPTLIAWLNKSKDLFAKVGHGKYEKLAAA